MSVVKTWKADVRQMLRPSIMVISKAHMLAMDWEYRRQVCVTCRRWTIPQLNSFKNGENPCETSSNIGKVLGFWSWGCCANPGSLENGEEYWRTTSELLLVKYTWHSYICEVLNGFKEQGLLFWLSWPWRENEMIPIEVVQNSKVHFWETVGCKKGVYECL